MRLEDLQPRCAVRGVHPDGLVTVVSVQWFGSEALELTYKTPAGTVADELLYRQDETRRTWLTACGPRRTAARLSMRDPLPGSRNGCLREIRRRGRPAGLTVEQQIERPAAAH